MYQTFSQIYLTHKSNNSSPSYLFYETTKGYHFRTFDSMCREEPKFYFKETVGAVT